MYDKDALLVHDGANGANSAAGAVGNNTSNNTNTNSNANKNASTTTSSANTTTSNNGAYVLITRAPSGMDISKGALARRRFVSVDDPYKKTGTAAWGAGVLVGGTEPDALDNSTHPLYNTAGANQSWSPFPVEFGDARVWKVAGTTPPTYMMFAEMHWLWMMLCWKGVPGCQDGGCHHLPPDEPCQPVDVRLAVSRDGLNFHRRNATPTASTIPEWRCNGMCDPDGRRAFIGTGMAGSWYSRASALHPGRSAGWGGCRSVLY